MSHQATPPILEKFGREIPQLGHGCDAVARPVILARHHKMTPVTATFR